MKERRRERKCDYSLYLVTDRKGMEGSGLCQAVEQAILGGCTMVQLREKSASAAEFFRLAEAVKQVTDRYRIPLVINDRIDVALAVGAAGVHLGQSDLPASAARKAAGDGLLLGVSVTSLKEAVRAQADGADYLGVGAMLPSRTKEDAAIVSRQEFVRIRRAVTIPIVVIGGIRKENAAEFLELGADGIAVCSAILSQPDIRRAAMELKGEVSGQRCSGEIGG